MRYRRIVAAAIVAAAFGSPGGLAQQTVQSPLAGFHKDVDPAIDALWTNYDRAAAMDHVRFISQYWRLAGNPGYNATVDRIQARLKSAGIATSVEEYPTGPAWDHSAASLNVIRQGAPDEVVLSRDKDRLTLCINSFSTPEGGVTGRLVDVGRGTDQDYAGKELKGTIVLGDADAGTLFRRAVIAGGAAGVVSTTLPGYLNADVPGAARATPRDQWDILQWTSVPYDNARKSFGFKASPRAAATLRKRLADAGPNTPVMLKVNITASFSTGPARTLVAEIPGTVAPSERIVLAAHIQEPGANDNASGVATLAEMAVAMATSIKQKKIAAPGRTITFLFLNEISGSRRWIEDHPDDAKQVKYMFSLDMTGEDVAKTGGSFLVERYPDPGAVWERPWDPHSEWGKGNVRAESLKGDLLNDTHLAVLRRVAEKTKWVVKTNPYEGGSDHTVFGTAGVPSVLDWHFTDRYYHTNFDTPDKTSPGEMRNVGVGAGASAWLLASADAARALNVAVVVASAGEQRVALEKGEGAKLVAAAPDRAAADTREATIVTAWRKWYREAVRSVARLVIGPVTPDLQQSIDRLSAPFDQPAKTAELVAESAESIDVFGPMVAPESTETPDQQSNAQLFTAPPIFTCGSDESLPEPIPVRWSTIVLAGDGRLYRPCPIDPRYGEKHPPVHRESREAAVIYGPLGIMIVDGSTSSDPVPIAGARAARTAEYDEAVQRAVQVVSRLRRESLGSLFRSGANKFLPACNAEASWQPGLLFLQMRNANAVVRREAAYGIAVKLSETEGELLKKALIELRACFDRETSEDVQALLLEGWGIARYETDAQRAAAETFLIAETRKSEKAKARLLGATKALEALIRLAPRRPVSDDARTRLRELALFGRRLSEPNDVDARIRRLAMMALQGARDTDAATLRAAADDVDWQVRRLVGARLNLNDPEQSQLISLFKDEPAFQVRYELVGAIARQASTTRLCAPLVARFKDPAPLVAMRAMDALLTTCTDLDDAVAKLVEIAKWLDEPRDTGTWHLPARAFTALARLKPEEAMKRLAAVAKQPTWQVRATAATAAGVLAAEDVAVTLSKDEVPNVQNAALETLQRMKSPEVVPRALFVLETASDHQLLRTAALVLRGLPAEAKEKASEALLGALKRLTEEGSDTSRDPRVAILERLGETLAPQRSSDLVPYGADFDDEVIDAASKAFQQIVGTPLADVREKRRRYPMQPTEQTLQKVWHEAHIELEEGTVVISLLSDVAPVTVARFVALVNEGAYDNRTFHRVVPNFVVQGGSPGANEYSGTTTRFMRDEVGPQASHTRGAVGISTRGRDTGDAQIFIDLVDLPRLDRDYTVFGYVINPDGMEIVDRLLEGAVIKRITVR
jgi:cyclophilin family peptidyl-prolyl cis-trans isomerase